MSDSESKNDPIRPEKINEDSIIESTEGNPTFDNIGIDKNVHSLLYLFLINLHMLKQKRPLTLTQITVITRMKMNLIHLFLINTHNLIVLQNFHLHQ